MTISVRSFRDEMAISVEMRSKLTNARSLWANTVNTGQSGVLACSEVA